MQVGVEIGGTFTDLVAYDNEGNITNCKVFSTPESPEKGALDALKAWGGEMETTDWGDYEAYDSTVERVDFNRVDESITSQMGYIEIQDLLFNFWLKVGPTLDTDKLIKYAFQVD